jgi:hypothetical protein
MPIEKFWSTIALTAGSAHDADAQENALYTAMRGLTLDEIISFEMTFRALLNNAYTWDLWGAAYVIHGGCSDDGFEYFRRWLVSRGQKVYDAAMADPENLAQIDLLPGPDGVLEFEGIYYVAMSVFKEKGGEGDVREYSEIEAGMDGSEPAGEPFSEEDLAQRYPKLWQRFGSSPLG